MNSVKITANHEGANIEVLAIRENLFRGPANAEILRPATEKILSVRDNKVLLCRDQRGASVWWHYWSFCVENGCNKTICFEFIDGLAVGPFGVAVSYDLKNWQWSGVETVVSEREFRYTFSSDESKVYFCIYNGYLPGNWNDFLSRYGLTTETLCMSEKNRQVELLQFGNGQAEKNIVFTARHHACETSGSYVLEGMLSQMLEDNSDFLRNYNISVIPFVDIDGVVEGDSGNFRAPHNFNRDYIDDSVYNATQAIKKYLDGKTIVLSIDCHSPKLFGEINDPLFFFLREEPVFSRTKKLLELFEKNIDKDCFNYSTQSDIAPGVGHNVFRSMTCCGYILSHFAPNITVAMEAPFFGMPDNVVTPARLINCGRALGKAIITYCGKYLED